MTVILEKLNASILGRFIRIGFSKCGNIFYFCGENVRVSIN